MLGPCGLTANQLVTAQVAKFREQNLKFFTAKAPPAQSRAKNGKFMRGSLGAPWCSWCLGGEAFFG
jgi:hypothetical protein